MKTIFKILSILLFISILTSLNLSKIKAMPLKEVANCDIATLKQGVDVSTTLEHKGTSPITVSKIVHISSSQYVIVGSTVAPTDTQDDQNYPYVAYYYDNLLVWEKVEMSFGCGMMVDATYTDETIVVVGSANSNQYTVFIQEYTKSKQLIREHLEISNELLSISDIFNYQNFYIITGTTYSKKAPFSAGDAISKVYIASLLKDNLSPIDVSCYGNNGNNILFSSVMREEDIFMYMVIDGDGYYYNETNDQKFYAVLQCNNRTEMENYTSLDKTNTTLIDLTINPVNKNLVVGSYSYGSGIISLKEYDLQLNIIKRIDYRLPQMYITSFCLSDYNSEKMLLSYKLFDQYYTVVLNEEYVTKKTYNEKCFNQTNISGCTYYQYFCCTYGDIKGSPFLANKSYLKLNSDNQCYLDDKLITGTVITTYEKDTFGVYDVVYRYTVDNTFFDVTHKIEVPLNINIEDKATYDVGLRLDFNCEAMLDYNKIASGYVVLNEGVHVLELIGTNKVINYTFVIKEKSVEITNTQNDFNLKVNLQNPILSVEKEQVIEKSPLASTSLNENAGGGIFIALFIVLIGFSFGLFFPIRRQKNG